MSNRSLWQNRRDAAEWGWRRGMLLRRWVRGFVAVGVIGLVHWVAAMQGVSEETEPMAGSELFFAEDVSPHPSVFFGGANQVARPVTPKSAAAAAAFRGRLPDGHVESFETLAPGSVPSELILGEVRVRLSGENEVRAVLDPADTANGSFPFSGTRGLAIRANAGSEGVVLEFSSPQTAFGFFGTDIELNGLTVTLRSDTGDPRTLTIPVERPQGSGGAFFWGVIDRRQPFSIVQLEQVGRLEDDFLLDDLIVANVLPERVTNGPPAIAPLGDRAIEQDTATGAIPLEIGDKETPAAELHVTVRSSHSALLADDGMVVRGGGTNRTLTLTPAPGRSGSVSVTVTVTDAGGLSAATQFVLTVRPPARPPWVQLTEPPPGTVLVAQRSGTTVSAPVRLVAEAGAPDGSVTRVDFLLDETILGRATGAPFSFDWADAPPGRHRLSARATDDTGRVGRSDPVEILVVNAAAAEVALVGPAAAPEMGRMEEALRALGIGFVRFERGEVIRERLGLFRVVVWNGTHLPNLTGAELSLLEALAVSTLADGQRVSLYFLGSNLFELAQGLPAAEQGRWQQLLRANAIGVVEDPGEIRLEPGALRHEVAEGVAGSLRPFQVAATLPRVRASSETAVIAQRGASAVVVVSPDEPQRTVSQFFGMTMGRGTEDLRVLRALFQNTVWWLLRQKVCPFPVVLEVQRTDTQHLPEGAVGYCVKMRRAGDCSVRGSSFYFRTEPDVWAVDVRSSSGQWEAAPEGGVLRLGSGVGDMRQVDLCLVLRAFRAGTWPVRFEAHVFQEDLVLGENQVFAETVTVPAAQPVDLVLESRASGGWELRLKHAQAGERYVVEESTDLRRWRPMTAVADQNWVQPLPETDWARFFRVVAPVPCALGGCVCCGRGVESDGVLPEGLSGP